MFQVESIQLGLHLLHNDNLVNTYGAQRIYLNTLLHDEAFLLSELMLENGVPDNNYTIILNIDILLFTVYKISVMKYLMNLLFIHNWSCFFLLIQSLSCSSVFVYSQVQHQPILSLLSRISYVSLA
uniref:Uncharacterized protein n=1 Tax=Cacopsylla melanoneura TaxID=428564 RepID=A0A8D8UZA7_9HEMI